MAANVTRLGRARAAGMVGSSVGSSQVGFPAVFSWLITVNDGSYKLTQTGAYLAAG